MDTAYRYCLTLICLLVALTGRAQNIRVTSLTGGAGGITNTGPLWQTNAPVTVRYDLDANQSVFTIYNRDASLANAPTSLAIDYDVAGSANAIYALFRGDVAGAAIDDFKFSQTGLTLGGGITITYADGTKQTFNPNGTTAGLNVGSHAGDPSAPANGDLWYDLTANELTARINGANVALGASGGGSANYINQPHTNVSFVNTATNVLSGNAPADGSFNTWHHYRTHTNQPYFDYSIGYSKFPNVGSALSNDVAFTGWGWGGSTTNMMGGIWHERWYRPNSGNPAQQEWYLRFDGTNGFFQDRRPFMFEWKEDGNWAGPFIRGTPTFQNIGATTNLLELRDNFAHTMVADTFAINGVNAGRAEVRMRQRGTVAFYNTANSLSWALTIHPNENGLAIFGNDAGATNVIVTNFNSAPMILGIPRGGLEIGPSSATVSNILVATATLDFGSTLSCTNSDLPITVTGTTTNDFAQLCIPFQVGNTPGASFNHFLSNDTVWVRFVNNRTNAAVDPVAGVFRALVTKVR